MTPFTPNLILLVLSSVLLLVNFVLPMVNLHLILNRELNLKHQAQLIIDNARYAETDMLQMLTDITVPGIEILEILPKDFAKDYVQYQIQFQHNSLFKNSWLKAEDLYKPRFLSLIIDKE